MEFSPTATIFYATSEELTCWLQDWQNRYSLHAVAGRILPAPSIIRELSAGSFAETDIVREYETICLGTQQLDSYAEFIKQVVAKNPGSLVVRCPRYTGTTMGYGTMSATPPFSESLPTWETIHKDLLSMTEPGVWYGIPGKRKRVLEPAVRYSIGAANLFQQGITLLGAGKTVVIQLGMDI